MGKNPAFLFYPNDYLRDTQAATPSVRGIWMDLLSAMWWSHTRGVLTGTEEEMCRYGRCSIAEWREFLAMNARQNFADVTECNKIVTVSNRRMVREEKERESTRSRVQRHRNKVSNAEVTVPLPVPSTPSTPVSPPRTKKKRKVLLANPDGFAAFWSRYPKKLGKDKAQKAWNVLNPQNGLVELILSSIDAHCRTPQWQDIQYIPYPATFLNGKRWEDDLMSVQHISNAERLWYEAQEEKRAS